MITDPDALTPWENRNGRWYKREDYHRNIYGVNGAKYRACRHMMVKAIKNGYDHVVSAQSVLSPQSPIVSTLAEELGMHCTLVYGASKEESALRHRNVAIASAAGADFDFTPRVAYNGVIQPYAAKLAEKQGAWQLPYAISMPEDSSQQELRDFMWEGGYQAANLPKGITTLVISFGSGNTTAGMMYGLAELGCQDVERVVLVGVGPDRTDWLHERLNKAGVGLDQVGEFPFEIQHMPLHGWFANYGDSMKATEDDIVMHPTYEGKAVRFLNGSSLDWWHNRDNTTGFWIVGGPLG